MRATRAESHPLYVIYKERKGHLKDLESKLDKRSIGQLEAMGYIENAPSADGGTWKISRRADHMARLKYGKPSLLDKLSDWYYFKVRKVEINI